jgi:hypothetical protein
VCVCELNTALCVTCGGAVLPELFPPPPSSSIVTPSPSPLPRTTGRNTDLYMYHPLHDHVQKEATTESPGKAPDYDAAELAEANAMLVKMLRASKATANEQPSTIEDVAPPAK